MGSSVSTPGRPYSRHRAPPPRSRNLHAAWQALIATVSIAGASATLGHVIGPTASGLLLLLVAMAQGGTAAYYAALHNSG